MIANMVEENSSEERFKIIATRLLAARRVSGLNQLQVAQQIGQKNMTQVSLWESGDRLPKLMDLIRMSEIYKVPMDFICGLSDDPLADAQENRQGFLANLIGEAINKSHFSWLKATAESVAVTIDGHSHDRADLHKIGGKLTTLRKAFARLKELNPGFEEDMRGSASLTSAMEQLEEVIESAAARLDRERRQCQIIDEELQVANGDFERRASRESTVSVTQTLLDLGGEARSKGA